MDALIGIANRSVRLAKSRLKEIEDRKEQEQRALYQGPFFLEVVRIVETVTLNGITYYRFEATRKDGKPPFLVDLRYSDLAKAKERMSTHARERADFFLNPQYEFPRKNINCQSVHIYHMDLDEIEQRKQQLEMWVQERVTFVHKRDRDPAWVQQHHLHNAISKIENELNKLFRVHEQVDGFFYGQAATFDSAAATSSSATATAGSSSSSQGRDVFGAGAYGSSSYSSNFHSSDEYRGSSNCDNSSDDITSGGEYGKFGDSGRRNSISDFISRSTSNFRRMSFSSNNNSYNNDFGNSNNNNNSIGSSWMRRASFSHHRGSGIEVSSDGNTIKFTDPPAPNTDNNDSYHDYNNNNNSSSNNSSSGAVVPGWNDASDTSDAASYQQQQQQQQQQSSPLPPPPSLLSSTLRFSWRTPPPLAAYNASAAGISPDINSNNYNSSHSSDVNRSTTNATTTSPVSLLPRRAAAAPPPSVLYQQQLEQQQQLQQQQQQQQQLQQQQADLLRRSTYTGSSLTGSEAFV